MHPCIGKGLSEIIWQHSRTGCSWLISIMRNGFAGSGLRLLGGYFNAKYKHFSMALDPNPYCIISFSEKILFLFLVFSNWYWGNNTCPRYFV